MAAEHPRVAGGQLGSRGAPRIRLARATGAVRPGGSTADCRDARRDDRGPPGSYRRGPGAVAARDRGGRGARRPHRAIGPPLRARLHRALAAAIPRPRSVYLERAWEIRDDVQLLEPGHRLELADTLEALISVGELEEAERSSRPWEERARLLDRAWALAITARCRALLLAARGDLAGAQVELRARAGRARTGQDPFQHARTLLVLGATQRRAKQRGAARATLSEALAASSGSALRSGPRRRAPSSRGSAAARRRAVS